MENGASPILKKLLSQKTGVIAPLPHLLVVYIYLILFQYQWCKNCIKELEAIAEIYEDWQDETNAKLIAISIDDSRNTSKLKPFINSKGWEYEIYHDPNSDFKRALGINQIPRTFLLNGKNEIISEHVGYTDGQEEELYDKIKKLIK